MFALSIGDVLGMKKAHGNSKYQFIMTRTYCLSWSDFGNNARIFIAIKRSGLEAGKG